MKLAYLLNQYPMPSQTFIRREIAALEAQGIPVERFTLRHTDGSVVDPVDRAEIDRTRGVLDVGPHGLAGRSCDGSSRTRPSSSVRCASPSA